MSCLPQLKLELEQLAASIEQIDEVIQQAATNSITHEARFVVDLKTGGSLLPTLVSMDGKPIFEVEAISVVSSLILILLAPLCCILNFIRHFLSRVLCLGAQFGGLQ